MSLLDSLSQYTPIVDDKGRPTREFMIKWAQLMSAASSIRELTTAAEVSAVLDVISAHEGDILIRGATEWEELAIGPADDVLTSNGTTPSWQPPSGGAFWELGELHPPAPGTLVTSPSTSMVSSLALTSVSEQGTKFYGSGFGAANAMACAMRSPSTWATPWTVVARLVGSVHHSQYPQWGLFMIDTSGKVQGVHALMSTAPAQYNEYDVRLNSVNASFNAVETSMQVNQVADWFRLRNDGTNYYFGTSYDGVMWEETSSAISAFLGTLAWVGIGICFWQNSSVGSPANSGGVLCTYYSDPSYP